MEGREDAEAPPRPPTVPQIKIVLKQRNSVMPPTKRDGISRVERAAMARALREQGHTRKEIMTILEISQSYLGSLLTDPDGSKDRLRKEKYRGTCNDCGGPTTYSSPDAQVQRCLACSKHRQFETRRWRPERIIADIQEWDRIYGEPPRAQQWLIEVHGDGTKNSRRWPHVIAVQREFGSWSNGLEAAGFPRRKNYERTEEWKAKVRKWPPEKIIEKLQEWAVEHGHAPAQLDWTRNRGKWPSSTTVLKRFGTWNKALDAAGLRPRHRKNRSERALAEFEDQLLLGLNGGKGVEIPSFASRGEGKSLIDVVQDLSEGR